MRGVVYDDGTPVDARFPRLARVPTGYAVYADDDVDPRRILLTADEVADWLASSEAVGLCSVQILKWYPRS